MLDPRDREPLVTEAWLREQELRAEWEAAEFRRLRQSLRTPPPTYAAPAPDPHSGGSAILKGLVRFIIGAFGAYVAYIATLTIDGAGKIDAWFAVGAGFVISMALTAFGPLRALVHVLSETARWTLLIAFCVALLWLAVQVNANVVGA